MKRFILAAALCLAAVPAWALFDANSPGLTVNGPYRALGYQQLSVSTATGLTVPTNATIAEICAEGTVRYRDDGTAPTASVGMPVFGSTTAPICFPYSGPLSAFQVIATTGTVTVDVAYYK